MSERVSPRPPISRLLLAPYRVAFYSFLALRRGYATVRPSAGGAWRTWVTPDLLLGGFMAPGDARALVAEGVGAIVNVSHELVPPLRSIEAAGLDYHHVPCWDMRAPSLEDTERAVDFIARSIAQGRKVYVHCASGVGRSVITILCYLATREGRDIEEALADIRKRRPRVNPSRAQRGFVDEFVAWRKAGGARPSDGAGAATSH